MIMQSRSIVRRRPLAAGALALALVSAGCSGEDIAERVAEEAMEGSGEAEVDIDADSGTMTTDEGSLTVGGGELPGSFPDELPLPSSDYEVGSSFEQTTDEGDALNVNLLTTGTPDDIADELRASLEDAGWSVEQTSRSAASGMTTVITQAYGHGHGVLLTVTGAEDDDEVTVGYVVGPDDR